MFRLFQFVLLLLLMSLVYSCQPNGSEGTTASGTADSLGYKVSEISKSVACGTSDSNSCLSIKIEQLQINNGTSAEARDKINASLNKMISDADNTSDIQNTPGQIATNLEKEYTRIKKEMPHYDMSWSYTRNFDVYLNSNGLFGVTLNAHSFTGGAHGVDFTYYKLFDIDNGQVLSLEQLIKPGSLPQLQNIGEQRFRQMENIAPDQSIAGAGYHFENEEFAFNDNFKYSKAGLEILYNVYEIAPHSDGPISLVFPYDEIKNYIRAEYRFPENQNEE